MQLEAVPILNADVDLLAPPEEGSEASFFSLAAEDVSEPQHRQRERLSACAEAVCRIPSTAQGRTGPSFGGRP